MFNSKISMQMFQSKLTLVLILVVFLSQLFPTCIAADVYSVSQNAPQTYHLENSLPLALQQACCDSANNECHHMVEVVDDPEQDNHFHTACHPPVELSLLLHTSSASQTSPFNISVPTRHYAPPIPPPYS
ncbi:hypothetical protein [Shewanella youngdeokensis]|uniref:Uncharacterized protein n=1 Tax=Shewanella youngdeokensis TaxID=2999068 RepID=A0ABZ0JUR7_9GAMM|nr:hypothetical protein RGE70_11605 [Shewanella sp. DAU334]